MLDLSSLYSILPALISLIALVTSMVTVPAFGLASKIIKANFSHVASEMLKGNEQKIIGIDDLPIVYATALPVSYPHYELFRLFFDDLTRKNITSKNTLADTLKSIEFGV